MKRRLLWLAACIVGVCGFQLPANASERAGPLQAGDANHTIATDFRQKADNLARAYHEADLFDGVVAVADLEGTLYAGAFGSANIPFDVRYTLDTRVRLASVSKPFTAAILLRLEEEDLLRTSDTVGALLPELTDAPFANVTIDQLLSHRSGIANYQYKPPYQALQTRVLTSGMQSVGVSTDDMIATFRAEPLSFVPGENYAYSNANYVLLQKIIETRTGSSFDEALQSYIFGPLGMTGSGTVSYRDAVPLLADGYVAETGGLEAPLQGQFVGSAAAGGIYSTAGDMIRWFQALFTGRFFTHAETLEKLIAPRAKAYNAQSFIGYGLFTSFIDVGQQSVRAVGHDGWGPPFTANLQFLPDRGLIVFAADSTGGVGSATYGETVRMGEDMVRLAYGVEPSTPRRPADLFVAGLLSGPSIPDPDTLRKALVDAENVDVSDERTINALGYTYLRKRELSKAVAVFRLNTQLFPSLANAFDSLAEAHAARGDWSAARDAYRAALERDPSNERIQAAMRDAAEKAK